MRAIIPGILIALGFGGLAALVLAQVQKPSFEVYTTQSVRLGDPGHNLVGQNWAKGNSDEHPL